MRAEIRLKKDAEAREKKISAGLEPLLATRSTDGLKKTNDESSGSDLDIDHDDDPWRGTQLQGFMSTTLRKDQERTLIGLQGHTSNTRAAAGFTAPEKPGIALTPHAHTITKRDVASRNEEYQDGDDNDDDDDLDAPPPQAHSGLPARLSASNKASTDPKHAVLGKSILERRNPNPDSSQKVKVNSKRSFLDVYPSAHIASHHQHGHKKAIKISPPTPSSSSSPPPCPPPVSHPDPQTTHPPKPNTLQQRLMAKRRREKEEEDSEKRMRTGDGIAAAGSRAGTGKGRLEEIPMFLV